MFSPINELKQQIFVITIFESISGGRLLAPIATCITSTLSWKIHTQIHGVGRIQKFTERDENTLYEHIVMSPGYTHDPFARIEEDGLPTYPWHRYYSDSDCIWLAIEFHPN
ncbi:hypothetical protein PPS11_02009 [Pseudomonas putida S11]|nr:hypothetical protein PPS11_02009 [Pseudomonas putida S11]